MEIRTVLRNIRLRRGQQYSTHTTNIDVGGKWIVILIKIPVLILMLFLGGLAVPLIIGLLFVILSLLISPIYVIGSIMVRNINSSIKKCAVTSVIILYPIISIIMTLFLIAFVVSYFLFGSRKKQDIYKTIEVIMLNYVFSYLQCFSLLIYI